MADGSRHSLYSVEEATYGETPTDPALDQVRITSCTLALNKDPLVSEEIRNDRQISDVRLGANQVSGEIGFELSYGSFDQFLEAVLLSVDWASPADTGVATLDATATGYERASGDFVADGFAVGQTVVASGFVGSGYNGASVITAVDALTMTTTPLNGTHGIETGDGDEQITASQRIGAGVERRSFTMIRHFSDIQTADKPYQIFRGCEIQSISFTVSANTMVTGTMTVTGQSLALSEDLAELGTPTYNPVSTTRPVDTYTGTLNEDGSVIAVITEISMELQNNIEPRWVVGSDNTIFPSIQRSDLTGTITAFFENSDLLQKFISETESNADFSMPDPAGNILKAIIPRFLYTGAPPDVSGEGPVTLAMPFQAMRDATLGTNLIFERTPVA